MDKRVVKYRNIRTEVDNITFASKKEAKRYNELKLLEKGKVISNLQLQPKLPIEINGTKVCTYIGDFAYNDVVAGMPVVEDCKGFKTPAYRLKKKLVKAVYDIDIRET